MQVVIRLACVEHACSEDVRCGERWSRGGADACGACDEGGARAQRPIARSG